nr:MAG: putative maturation protein [Leviviridae sp.]
MIRDIGYLKLAAQRLLSKEHLRRLQLDKSARGLANQQLSVQMGWQPLISDLAKLVDFQGRVDRKVVELDTLFNKNGGLHRTVGNNPDAARKPGSRQRQSLWSNSVESTSGTITLDSAIGQLIQAVAKTHTSAESWGSIRWEATSTPKTHYSNKELTRRARNIVLGLNLTPKQIWDAVPWSWLVGWFTNIDEYLGAHTNVIPVTCSNVCIMRRTRTTVSYSRVGAGITTFVGGIGTTIYETKSRSVTSGSLSASIPFLSGRQLSILGALAIQRIR